MMDDVRPLSLPTNDCAASNESRIERRPGTALRPSSERLGRVTLKRKTLAIANKVVSSEDPFRNLSDDILGDILARLSLFSFKVVKKVCKRWASVTSTPEFDILRKELNPKPFLVLYGISARSRNKSQSFAYDVENNAWVILPGLQFPSPQFPSPQFRSHYKYGSFTGTWESYGDLPWKFKKFKSYNSQTWMSGVVCANKFYVSSLRKSVIDEVHIHSLDLYTKQWACMTIQLGSYKVLYCSRIIAIGSTLVVDGVCIGERFAVKLWKVDLKTLSLIQIGLMPSKLVALLGDVRPLTFLSDENFVYFSLNGEHILAEVSLEECKTSWRLLPAVWGVKIFLASISSA